MNGLRDRLLLYAVTDRAWLSASLGASATLEDQVGEAMRGGATIVQLREKGLDDAAYAALARRIKAVTDAFGVPLIINDSLESAIASDASARASSKSFCSNRDAAARRSGRIDMRWLGLSPTCR